jgi:hypothetical protein
MTAQAQHVLDFALVLTDLTGPAEAAVIDAVALRLIRDQIDYQPLNGMEVVNLERQYIFLLRDDYLIEASGETVSGLGYAPEPMTRLVVDGREWLVEAVPLQGQVLQLGLMRYLA